MQADCHPLLSEDKNGRAVSDATAFHPFHLPTLLEYAISPKHPPFSMTDAARWQSHRNACFLALCLVHAPCSLPLFPNRFTTHHIALTSPPPVPGSKASTFSARILYQPPRMSVVRKRSHVLR